MTTPLAESPPLDDVSRSGEGRGQPPVFEAPAPDRSNRKPEGRLAKLADWLIAGQSSAWLGSAALHLLAILILSLLWFQQPRPGRLVLVSPTEEMPEAESLDLLLDQAGAAGMLSREQDDTQAAALPREAVAQAPRLPTRTPGPTETPRPLESFWPTLPTNSTIVGGGMEGRAAGRRRGLALAGGGTPASEDAVERGLAWLAAHQHPDGAWRFDLEECPGCNGACGDSGFFDSSTAATGLALLTFLGAGYTHEQGPYQSEVQQGIYYLTENLSITSLGGDLRDKNYGVRRVEGIPTLVEQVQGRGDNMYSHGIAALALTEAYAMSNDPELKAPAQLAVDFIVNAQFDDGGWRYRPATESAGPGDMTVTGWQVMALKSGALAGLNIPYDTWLRLDGFLDDIQTSGGSQYRYVRRGEETRSTTAIGLLCRMFRHWPRDHRPLVKGLRLLGRQQPENNHIYYNYYASQVLHHAGGPAWKRWNQQMRDYLLETQARVGHEAGSWYFNEPHSSHGGRIYTTALAIMTLEVYYRYMPLYQEAILND